MTAPLVRRSPAHRGVVVSTSALTARLRRVTVRADELRGVVVRPAQDVELLLREPTGRRVKRRYTIRHSRPHAGEVDLDVLLHGAGPGADWGASAQPGDVVDFQGPRGKLELRNADWHLLAGDTAALPAIATIIEALPRTEPALAIIEVADADDEVPGELPPGAQVRWLRRGLEAAGGSRLLGETLAELPLTAGAGRGYLLGETRAMVALRAVLEGRGLAHDAIFVKGYWNLGRRVAR